MNQTGWECPRCFKIHSPYSLTCDCAPRVFTTGGTTPIINCCNHYESDAGTAMNCKNCGKPKWHHR